MSKKQGEKHYTTDLRVSATPHQVASALVREGKPRQEKRRPNSTRNKHPINR